MGVVDEEIEHAAGIGEIFGDGGQMEDLIVAQVLARRTRILRQADPHAVVTGADGG